MPRKTREVVIAELIALDVEFAENETYKDLCRLLKLYSKPASPTVPKTGDTCIGCVREEVCHPNGVNFNSRAMASTCAEWKEQGDAPEQKPAAPQIKIVNRLKKINTFLSDAVRNERDTEFLNREIGKREYKGKLLRVTTVKEYEVSADGYWETAFIIELKE